MPTQAPAHRNALREELPLTVAQRGMWVSHLLADRGSVFKLAECVEIHGAVDAPLFLRALRRVADEADVARTQVVSREHGPVQVIDAQFDGDIALIDLGACADPWAEAMAWMRADIDAPLDLSAGALWRVALLTTPERSFWYHRVHHVTLDGHGAGLVAARVAQVYSALVAGADPGPSPFAPFRDVVAHEQAYRASPRFDGDRAYWMSTLADLPAPVSLARRPWTPSTGLLRASFEVDTRQRTELQGLATQAGASLPQVMTAVVAAFVHRLTGASDLVLGMPVSARSTPALRRVPGMVANAVALRLKPQAGQRFCDLIAQSRSACLGALRHQTYRYEDLRRDLKLLAAHRQLSWISVNFEPFNYRLSFAGLPCTVHNLSNGSVEDLAVFIYDRGDGGSLRIDLDANPALYDQAELNAHRDRLQRCLRALQAAPTAALRDIDLLAADERRRVLFDWNATAAAVDAVPWFRAFEAQAARQPDAPALVGHDELSAGELNRLANQLAHALLQRGIGAGHRVAVALPRDARLLVALLGVQKAGAAYVPIDPDAPPARTRRILEAARPILLLCDARPAAAAGLAVAVLQLDDPRAQRLGPDLPPTLPGHDPVDRERLTPLTADALAYVMFTSGSTGVPKGVMVGHGGLANLMATLQQRLRLRADDTWLAVTTIGFDIAALELYLPLASGARIALARRDEVRDPVALGALRQRTGASVLQATPSLWSLLLEQAGDAFQGVRALVGGERLSAPLARAMRRVAAEVVNLYGPTETTIWSTLARLAEDPIEDPPIGRPLGNTQCHVLDAELQPMPVGSVGELCIGGAGVALGYLGDPALTARQFVPNPHGPGRLYRTGDLARWRADGQLEFMGRRDEQIKLHGHRIEPGEIVAALTALPGVAQATVHLHAEDGGRDRLVAWVVARGEAPTATALRRRLQDSLPDAMVPAAIVFVDALPLTPNGKLDRQALPPPTATVVPADGARSPRTPTETILVGLFAEVLGLDVARIGIDDSLFELGGNSLAAARLIAALRTRFAIELPLNAVFGAPTIAGLAEQIDRAAHQDPFAEVLPLRGPTAPAGAATATATATATAVATTDERGDAATLPALFCLPPVLGLGWGYAGLLPHLPGRRPVVALQVPPERDGAGTCWEAPSLGALAARLLAQVRCLQPTGPYHLLGWSFGGLLAHEMARQLQATGERVGLLALLDAYPWPAADAAAPARSERDEVRLALALLGFDERDAVALPGSLTELAVHLCARYGLEAIPAVQGLLETQPDLFDRLRRRIESNLALARQHRPGPVDVPLLYFRARHAPAVLAMGAWQAAEASWAPWVSAMTVHEVDAGHQDMLSPGALRQFGPLLAQALAAHGAGAA